MTPENKPKRLDRRKFAEFVRQITGAETVRTNGEVFAVPGKRGKTLLPYGPTAKYSPCRGRE